MCDPFHAISIGVRAWLLSFGGGHDQPGMVVKSFVTIDAVKNSENGCISFLASDGDLIQLDSSDWSYLARTRQASRT